MKPEDREYLDRSRRFLSGFGEINPLDIDDEGQAEREGYLKLTQAFLAKIKAGNKFFEKVDLLGQRLPGLKLDGLTVKVGDWSANSLSEAVITDCRFENVRFDASDLFNATIKKATFTKCSFTGVIFSGVSWQEVEFIDCTFVATEPAWVTRSPEVKFTNK